MRAKVPPKTDQPSRAGYTIEEFLGMLDAVSKHGPGYIARCPAHDDGRPSLRVSEGDRGIMVNCWAGCSFHEITSAMGINPSLMFYDALDKHQVNERRLKNLQSELKNIEVRIYFGQQAMSAGTITDHERTAYRNYIARKIEIQREIEEVSRL